MPRMVFPLFFLVVCGSLAAACSSTTNPPPAGGTGSMSGSASGSGSVVSTGAMTGSGSGGASGAPMCSGSATVSFKNDIMPIFRASCAKAGGACHNDTTTYSKMANGGGRPYLGTAIDGGAETMADIGMVYAGLTKPSLEYTTPSINYITPCDPTKSFMMLKMDPSFSMIDVTHCSRGDFAGICGLPMPSDSTTGPLPQTTRDMVRNWISQGAMNN
jgi:hypothetical protein